MFGDTTGPETLKLGDAACPSSDSVSRRTKLFSTEPDVVRRFLTATKRGFAEAAKDGKPLAS
jgi:hypothetical protein